MNKCNLNVLCQKNKWELPVYSDMKDVQDHDPHFKASVVVNGITFDSSTMFKSKKMAYNDVAGLAFSYFTTLSQKEAPTDDAQEIKRLKVPAMGLCSNLDTGVLKATSESYLPVVLEDNATKIVFPDHSVLPIIEPNPNKYADSYLLCNKVRVYTSIPDMVLPKGNVVLPIGDGKWTIVSLESA